MNDLVVVNSAVAEYQFSKRALSPNTIKSYTTTIDQFLKYCVAQKLEPSPEAIQSFLNTFDNAKTYNNKYAALKSYFKFFFRHESAERQLEAQESLDKIKRRKPQKAVERTAYIDFKQFKELVKLSPPKMSVLIDFLFWTGCRISEATNVKLSNCRIEGKTVYVRIESGKGRKEGQVYISKKLYDKINAIYAGKKFLFETRKGTRLDRINATNAIKKTARDIIGVTISAHKLRHSLAMYLKGKGMSIDRIAAYLRHSSPSVTAQHYFHGKPSPEEIGIFGRK